MINQSELYHGFALEHLIRHEVARLTNEILPEATNVVVGDLNPRGRIGIAAEWPDGLMHAYRWYCMGQTDSVLLATTKDAMVKLRAWHQDHEAPPEEPIILK